MREEMSPLAIPVLPGLEGLHQVVVRVINELATELPEGYSKFDLQADLSDARNWYVAMIGHRTPSLEECMLYARGYINQARTRLNKPE